MEIKGFQELSFIDWPGKNTCIIFLNHCNFRCCYCHNMQLAVGMCSQNIPPSYILMQLKEKKDWIDGIVISGGEPTLNKDLINFCRDIKTFIPTISIKIDTNGTNPKMIDILLKENLIDKISMDIKAPLSDENLYNTICQANVPINLVENTINLIVDSNIDYEFRTTITPDLLSKEQIITIACELSCICGCVKQYTIQNFDNTNTKFKAYSYDKDILNNLKSKILLSYNISNLTIK